MTAKPTHLGVLVVVVGLLVTTCVSGAWSMSPLSDTEMRSCTGAATCYEKYIDQCTEPGCDATGISDCIYIRDTVKLYEIETGGYEDWDLERYDYCCFRRIWGNTPCAPPLVSSGWVGAAYKEGPDPGPDC
jgi:hypothetical protein